MSDMCEAMHKLAELQRQQQLKLPEERRAAFLADLARVGVDQQTAELMLACSAPDWSEAQAMAIEGLLRDLRSGDQTPESIAEFLAGPAAEGTKHMMAMSFASRGISTELLERKLGRPFDEWSSADTARLAMLLQPAPDERERLEAAFGPIQGSEP